jgi:dihydrofolate reductase
MKITLFLAMSIDGFIAKPDDSVTWSQDDWDNYAALCSEVGNLIVGRKTFELMKDGGDFEKLSLKNLVVVSKTSTADKSFGANWVTTPKEAVLFLEKKGCDAALVGGGRKLAHSFLTENLLSEIQLDVEPVIYGAGVPLFGEIKESALLELIEARSSGSNTARLHYRVK